LSEYEILLLQRKLKLGRIKPSTGPHAARGRRIAHNCFKAMVAGLWPVWLFIVTRGQNKK